MERLRATMVHDRAETSLGAILALLGLCGTWAEVIEPIQSGPQSSGPGRRASDSLALLLRKLSLLLGLPPAGLSEAQRPGAVCALFGARTLGLVDRLAAEAAAEANATAEPGTEEAEVSETEEMEEAEEAEKEEALLAKRARCAPPAHDDMVLFAHLSF